MPQLSRRSPEDRSGAFRAMATLVAVAGAIIFGGCQHGEFGQRRLDARERKLARTAAVAASETARRPTVTAEKLRGIERRRSERSAADLERAERYWDRDCRRWGDRQEDYGRALGRIFGGQPGDIGRYAIIFFF